LRQPNGLDPEIQKEGSQRKQGFTQKKLEKGLGQVERSVGSSAAMLWSRGQGNSAMEREDRLKTHPETSIVKVDE